MIDVQNSYNEICRDVVNVLNSTNSGKQQFIFVTGAAGTGKTTLIERVQSQCSKRKIVVAPTGIAALNVGGQTIHSAFRIPIDPMPKIRKHKDKGFNQLLKNLDLLIIDEISMVKSSLLDAVSDCLKKHRESKLPFGGVSVLVCGDLFQLPPVVDDEAEKEMFLHRYESVFFFDALCIQQLKHSKIIELPHSFRHQEDQEFITLLNNIRLGSNLEETVKKINKVCFEPEIEMASSMTVTSTNRLANRMNQSKLNQIENDEVCFDCRIDGEIADNWLPAPKKLVLKEGAQVIFTKNDSNKRWVNGSLGTVSNLSVKNKISVKIKEEEVEVERAKWTRKHHFYNSQMDDMEVEDIATFQQFPMKLGWAVTVHKSQGLTLESCTVDLGRGAFVPGQAYTALSRCKKLNSLSLITELKVEDILLEPRLVGFYENNIWN